MVRYPEEPSEVAAGHRVIQHYQVCKIRASLQAAVNIIDLFTPQSRIWRAHRSISGGISAARRSLPACRNRTPQRPPVAVERIKLALIQV